MGTVDDYLQTLDGASRAAYARILAVALAEVPEAEQGISYGMPTVKHRGKPVLGFKAAKDHLSVFPFSPAAVDAVRADLDGFSVSKGTIRFSPERPLPDQAVRRLVRARLAELGGGG